MCKKIAIVSKNEKIRDFFKFEAMNFDFSIDCLEKMSVHRDLSSYDLAIIDIDTISQKPLNSAKKQLFVSEALSDADIKYPMYIADLQKIYLSLFKSEPLESPHETVNDLKLIFYKDQSNLVKLKDKKYILSDAEYAVLKLLCENYPQPVSREVIGELFSNSNGNISDVYICKLRKKLEEPLSQRLIFTVRSAGYKIALESEWR